VLIRPTTDADLDRILAWPDTGPIGAIPADRYQDELDRHQYRPEWTWIAEDEGRIVARAIWWGFGDADYPLVLDCVSADDALPAGGSVAGRAAVAARLITAGQQALRRPGPSVAPGFEINLPTGWRSDPAVTEAFGWRHDAAARAGLTDELERIRFEWTPDAGLPRSSGRLVFRPEPDDDAFLDMFRQIAMGSLDVITRREVAALGAARQARDDMGIYLAMPGDRNWWRLAYTAGPDGVAAPDGADGPACAPGGGRPGQLAGMILPNCNSNGAVVGYLGVVPGLRGRGYINDLVAETTRFHAGRGERRIGATTDTTNLPMEAAFERAGYRAWGIRYVLSEPSGRPAPPAPPG
jgi:RimJ/RimL family protein N-acetyltransferase